LLSSEMDCRILPPSGPPVGVLDVEYEEHTLRLKPGDRMYLYSDGVTEAAAVDGELYGTGRLVELVLRQCVATLEESLAALMASIEAWNGGHARDDVSVLAVEF